MNSKKFLSLALSSLMAFSGVFCCKAGDPPEENTQSRSESSRLWLEKLNSLYQNANKTYLEMISRKIELYIDVDKNFNAWVVETRTRLNSLNKINSTLKKTNPFLKV